MEAVGFAVEAAEPRPPASRGGGKAPGPGLAGLTCPTHAQPIEFLCTRVSCLHELCGLCLLSHKEHIEEITALNELIARDAALLAQQDFSAAQTGLVELQSHHRDIPGDAQMLDDGAVDVRRGLLGIGGAAHDADDQVDGVRGGLGDPRVPAVPEFSAQGGQQCVLQRRVMLMSHTVFAVIAAELREECHGLFGALLDEFAQHPVERLAEGSALGGQVRWEEVARRQVAGEPPGVEAADHVVPAVRGVYQGPHRHQRFAVVKSHQASARWCRSGSAPTC